MNLDDWQAYVIGALFDVNADQEWAATEFGVLLSRQNGKGEVLVAYDLAHLFLFPRPDLRRKTILHTAHEMKTAVDGFQRLAGVVESNPRLMQRVKNVYTANGQEGIVLEKRPGQQMGDRIKFIARSRNSGRGFSGDVIVYDEAQELAGRAREALTYTQSTMRNRQELYTGTVPSELNDSEVFEGLRDRGRSGEFARTGWMEWSPTGSEDPVLAKSIDMADPAVWVESNPALGIRITAETVQEQFERSTDGGESFGRERLSIWPNRPPVEALQLSDLDMEQWGRFKGDEYGVTGGPGAVIAIALDRSGGFATIGAAVRRDSEQIAVEHKRTERHTRWVAEYVKELKAELGNALVVVDPKNAAPVISSLTEKRVKFLAMNLDEIAAAHALFVEYVNEGLVVHRDQPEVTKSLELATTRPLGRSGVTWEQSDPTKPISHTQAVTWALWGVLKLEASPPKKPAVVRGYA